MIQNSLPQGKENKNRRRPERQTAAHKRYRTARQATAMRRREKI
ncbi:hypothetical protein F528_0301 [Neisseria meningitidis 992008]|nr:hypothetical protein F528_0301 [Neisseria meningitidis 992008]